MAKPELERPVALPVLDRLLDDERGVAGERALSRAESVRATMDAVRRDLELLLNTRRVGEPSAELPEVATSVQYYGMPDITSMSRDSPDTRVKLARQVEEAIAAFEPRLEAVKVSVVPTDELKFGELRFTIEAVLRLDPSPERVMFDTVLEAGRGEVTVTGGGNA
ncbi:MAG TPA: type VI secretion system baseplate subunit TssE [Gemmatimonadales bacterium]|nr:type VI secretion system baseplate subunit TssE [Gemmatimonadales bacterium]